MCVQQLFKLAQFLKLCRAGVNPGPNRPNRADSLIKMSKVYEASGLQQITTTTNVHDPPKVGQQAKISKAICNGNILPGRERAAAQSRRPPTSILITRYKSTTPQRNGASRCTQTSVFWNFFVTAVSFAVNQHKVLTIFRSANRMRSYLASNYNRSRNFQ